MESKSPAPLLDEARDVGESDGPTPGLGDKPQPIEIVEVLGLSEQGLARPYLCRGEDGLLYYVKNRQSGRRSLWAEWICGHLAQGFGLNVPPFRPVHIAQDLLDECRLEWRELGCGIGFGSEQHPHATWLEPGMIQDVSVEEQQDIAVFDWWVHNLDRQVGNTNLLWDPQAERVVVIDFNNAFDPDISGAQFLEHHLFTGQLSPCFDDIVMQAQITQRLSSALERLHVACDTLPEEWRWLNPEMDVPADFDILGTTTLLQRFLNGQPWRP